jgi:hypothetical protein
MKTLARKKLIIDQLLKSKDHAFHLGISTDKQLETIDILLSKSARNILGPIPNFSTEAIHRPIEEMGMKYSPRIDRAAQVGQERITEALKRPTDRGKTAFGDTK